MWISTAFVMNIWKLKFKNTILFIITLKKEIFKTRSAPDAENYTI